MRMMDGSDGRIRGFDGLRAIAFILVFLSHKFPMEPIEAMGTIGVWLFFVLSGFLITRNLASHRAAIEQGRDSVLGALKDFYIRRTARIFPAYYALLIVATVLASRGRVNLGPEGRQLSNLFFVSNVYIERNGWVGALGHLWSLAVEEQFYIFFAPLVLLTPLARLKQLCLAVLAVSIAANGYHVWKGSWFVTFDVNSFINFGLLALGGLAGLSAGKPLPQRLASDAAMAVCLVLTPLIPPLLSGEQNAGLLMFGRVLGVLYALLLLQIVQRQDSPVVGFLETPVLRHIGLVSYGAYLYHLMSFQGLLSLLHLPIEAPYLVSVAAEFVLTMVVATASYRLMEQPIRNLARRRRPAPRPAMAEPPAAERIPGAE